jgi:cytochrome c
MRFEAGRLLLGAALALVIAHPAAAQEKQETQDKQDKSELEHRGQELLTTNCARCHAIGRTGESTHPEAPPFRTLGSRYPIDALAESLAEGLSSGHPDMPEFRFEIADVDAILAYLNAIQDPGQKP